jgi:ATP-dependent DNA ligase
MPSPRPTKDAPEGIMARRDDAGVQLVTRHGNDFTARFPFVADGLAVFDLVRRKQHGANAVLIAFDLIELDGEDLRPTSIEQRKRTLAGAPPVCGNCLERGFSARLALPLGLFC